MSLARNPHPEKCGAGNSAKKEFGVGVFTPKTDTETEAENLPADTRCGERRSEGVPRFAARDR
ncbi:MAG: hypothetical protein L5657_08810, partial [Calditerricola sp.]|nr:hypothetical protein [Calditerricola sp.]